MDPSQEPEIVNIDNVKKTSVDSLVTLCEKVVKKYAEVVNSEINSSVEINPGESKLENPDPSITHYQKSSIEHRDTEMEEVGTEETKQPAFLNKKCSARNFPVNIKCAANNLENHNPIIKNHQEMIHAETENKELHTRNEELKEEITDPNDTEMTNTESTKETIYVPFLVTLCEIVIKTYSLKTSEIDHFKLENADPGILNHQESSNQNLIGQDTEMVEVEIGQKEQPAMVKEECSAKNFTVDKKSSANIPESPDPENQNAEVIRKKELYTKSKESNHQKDQEAIVTNENRYLISKNKAPECISLANKNDMTNEETTKQIISVDSLATLCKNVVKTNLLKTAKIYNSDKKSILYMLENPKPGILNHQESPNKTVIDQDTEVVEVRIKHKQKPAMVDNNCAARDFTVDKKSSTNILENPDPEHQITEMIKNKNLLTTIKELNENKITNHQNGHNEDAVSENKDPNCISLANETEMTNAATTREPICVNSLVTLCKNIVETYLFKSESILYKLEKSNPEISNHQVTLKRTLLDQDTEIVEVKITGKEGPAVLGKECFVTVIKKSLKNDTENPDPSIINHQESLKKTMENQDMERVHVEFENKEVHAKNKGSNGAQPKLIEDNKSVESLVAICDKVAEKKSLDTSNMAEKPLVKTDTTGTGSIQTLVMLCKEIVKKNYLEIKRQSGIDSNFINNLENSNLTFECHQKISLLPASLKMIQFEVEKSRNQNQTARLNSMETLISLCDKVIEKYSFGTNSEQKSKEISLESSLGNAKQTEVPCFEDFKSQHTDFLAGVSELTQKEIDSDIYKVKNEIENSHSEDFICEEPSLLIKDEINDSMSFVQSQGSIELEMLVLLNKDELPDDLVENEINKISEVDKTKQSNVFRDCVVLLERVDVPENIIPNFCDIDTSLLTIIREEIEHAPYGLENEVLKLKKTLKKKYELNKAIYNKSDKSVNIEEHTKPKRGRPRKRPKLETIKAENTNLPDCFSKKRKNRLEKDSKIKNKYKQKTAETENTINFSFVIKPLSIRITKLDEKSSIDSIKQKQKSTQADYTTNFSDRVKRLSRRRTKDEERINKNIVKVKEKDTQVDDTANLLDRVRRLSRRRTKLEEESNAEKNKVKEENAQVGISKSTPEPDFPELQVKKSPRKRKKEGLPRQRGKKIKIDGTQDDLKSRNNKDLNLSKNIDTVIVDAKETKHHGASYNIIDFTEENGTNWQNLNRAIKAPLKTTIYPKNLDTKMGVASKSFEKQTLKKNVVVPSANLSVAPTNIPESPANFSVGLPINVPVPKTRRKRNAPILSSSLFVARTSDITTSKNVPMAPPLCAQKKESQVILAVKPNMKKDLYPSRTPNILRKKAIDVDYISKLTLCCFVCGANSAHYQFPIDPWSNRFWIGEALKIAKLEYRVPYRNVHFPSDKLRLCLEHYNEIGIISDMFNNHKYCSRDFHQRFNFSNNSQDPKKIETSKVVPNLELLEPSSDNKGVNSHPKPIRTEDINQSNNVRNLAKNQKEPFTDALALSNDSQAITSNLGIGSNSIPKIFVREFANSQKVRLALSNDSQEPNKFPVVPLTALDLRIGNNYIKPKTHNVVNVSNSQKNPIYVISGELQQNKAINVTNSPMTYSQKKDLTKSHNINLARDLLKTSLNGDCVLNESKYSSVPLNKRLVSSSDSQGCIKIATPDLQKVNHFRSKELKPINVFDNQQKPVCTEDRIMPINSKQKAYSKKEILTKSHNTNMSKVSLHVQDVDKLNIIADFPFSSEEMATRLDPTNVARILSKRKLNNDVNVIMINGIPTFIEIRVTSDSEINKNLSPMNLHESRLINKTIYQSSQKPKENPVVLGKNIQIKSNKTSALKKDFIKNNVEETQKKDGLITKVFNDSTKVSVQYNHSNPIVDLTNENADKFSDIQRDNKTMNQDEMNLETNISFKNSSSDMSDFYGFDETLADFENIGYNQNKNANVKQHIKDKVDIYESRKNTKLNCVQNITPFVCFKNSLLTNNEISGRDSLDIHKTNQKINGLQINTPQCIDITNIDNDKNLNTCEKRTKPEEQHDHGKQENNEHQRIVLTINGKTLDIMDDDRIEIHHEMDLDTNLDVNDSDCNDACGIEVRLSDYEDLENGDEEITISVDNDNPTTCNTFKRKNMQDCIKDSDIKTGKVEDSTFKTLNPNKKIKILSDISCINLIKNDIDSIEVKGDSRVEKYAEINSSDVKGKENSTIKSLKHKVNYLNANEIDKNLSSGFNEVADIFLNDYMKEVIFPDEVNDYIEEVIFPDEINEDSQVERSPTSEMNRRQDNSSNPDKTKFTENKIVDDSTIESSKHEGNVTKIDQNLSSHGEVGDISLDDYMEEVIFPDEINEDSRVERSPTSEMNRRQDNSSNPDKTKFTENKIVDDSTIESSKHEGNVTKIDQNLSSHGEVGDISLDDYMEEVIFPDEINEDSRVERSPTSEMNRRQDNSSNPDKTKFTENKIVDDSTIESSKHEGNVTKIDQNLSSHGEVGDISLDDYMEEVEFSDDDSDSTDDSEHSQPNEDFSETCVVPSCPGSKTSFTVPDNLREYLSMWKACLEFPNLKPCDVVCERHFHPSAIGTSARGIKVLKPHSLPWTDIIPGCCVRGCINKNRNTDIMVHIPYQYGCDSWLKAVQNPEIKPYSFKTLFRYRVCERHFNKKTLKGNSIAINMKPTLNLPISVQNSSEDLLKKYCQKKEEFHIQEQLEEPVRKCPDHFQKKFNLDNLNTCAIKTCSTPQSNGPYSLYFKIPTDDWKKTRKWLTVLGRQDIIDKGKKKMVAFAKDSRGVCISHLDVNEIQPESKNILLKPPFDAGIETSEGKNKKPTENKLKLQATSFRYKDLLEDKPLIAKVDTPAEDNGKRIENNNFIEG